MDPAVTAAAVKSTVAGAHTAAGFVMTTVGTGVTVTTTGITADAQPPAVVPLYSKFRSQQRLQEFREQSCPQRLCNKCKSVLQWTRQ